MPLTLCRYTVLYLYFYEDLDNVNLLYALESIDTVTTSTHHRPMYNNTIFDSRGGIIL